ncbi:MAG: hypothetical protein WC703_09370 [Candidatus Neomarinimicrobiota bacterium]
MEINYKITDISKRAIGNFPWIKSNFTLGELGSCDNREITRLLENSHYPHINRTLEQIDKYGSLSNEIGESLLVCNDSFVLSRSLAELSLFAYLYDNLKSKVTPIRRVQNQKSPDISVKLDDSEYLIEVFSPTDYYGYQVFSRLLISCLKNLDIGIGFKISIDSKAQNFGYTSDFPKYKDVYEWIEQFRVGFIKWIMTAKEGDICNVDSPTDSLKLEVKVESIDQNPKIRSISWNQATRSTDTICFFRINEPVKFANSQMGPKIKDKLQKQQAGEPRDRVLRILAINFGLADTSDLSFLNNSKYHANFDEHIKYLSSDIKPYPPYDVVLACELSYKCGFAKPVNLTSLSDKMLRSITWVTLFLTVVLCTTWVTLPHGGV